VPLPEIAMGSLSKPMMTAGKDERLALLHGKLAEAEALAARKAVRTLVASGVSIEDQQLDLGPATPVYGSGVSHAW
jgi:hypothetical protein